MATVIKDFTLDIELKDFDSDDLLDELSRRGVLTPNAVEQASELKNIVQNLYDAYRHGNAEQFDLLIKDLFYETIGRIA